MPKLMLLGERMEEECIELMRVVIYAHIKGKLPTFSVLESISVERNKIVLT